MDTTKVFIYRHSAQNRREIEAIRDKYKFYLYGAEQKKDSKLTKQKQNFIKSQTADR